MTAITPNDAHIRMALRKKLTSTGRGHSDTVVLDELGICRGEVRVDVAVVNGEIHGYEIKSDRDSLRRLASQVELYSKVLDQATLVAGERHFDAAAALLPEWWGLLLVKPSNNGPHLKRVRRAQKNPSRDARSLVELLWLEDSIALLERHGLDRGVRSKPRRIIWDRICESLDIEVIAAAVRAHLKTRAISTDHP
ncbi:MAG: sce7726 family protein [Acidiferrobacter thiooxydans]